MLCLFPFETEIYRRHGVRVRHVGHPLADEIKPGADQASTRARLGLDSPGPLLALLPGSREAEIRLLAPTFLRAARLLQRDYPELQLVIPAVSRERELQLQQILGEFGDIPARLLQGQSRDAMTAADAVLLASGTASLEAALLQRPMVVAYRMGWVSWQLLSRLVNTPYIALPNLLAGDKLVPELIQQTVTPPALADALRPLLSGGEAAARQLQGFDQLRHQLGQRAAITAAEALAELADIKVKKHG